MLKKDLIRILLVLSCVFMGCFITKAQNLLTINGEKRDQLVINPTWEHWLNVPENIDLVNYKNRGITLSCLVRLTTNEQNFGFATGVYFSSSNIFSDVGKWEFNEGEEVVSVVEDPDETYEKNKVSLNYLGVPVELQFKANQNDEAFKCSLGLKGGFLIDAHTKLKDNNDDIFKEKHIDAFNNLQYGPYLRIGRGSIRFTGYYGIANVFDADKAPDVARLSIGVGIIGL